MAEAVRQVATSAILVSQHSVVIHNAIVALQQAEKGNNKSSPNVGEVDVESKGHVG